MTGCTTQRDDDLLEAVSFLIDYRLPLIRQELLPDHFCDKTFCVPTRDVRTRLHLVVSPETLKKVPRLGDHIAMAWSWWRPIRDVSLTLGCLRGSGGTIKIESAMISFLRSF
jgi:hypothetical protein